METFTGNDLLEPIEVYKMRLKDAFHNNAILRYQEMTDKAKTNVEANQHFCAIYYEEMRKIKALKKSRGIRIFLLVLTFIAITAAIVAGVLLIKRESDGLMPKGILYGVLAIVGGMLLIVVAVLLIKKYLEYSLKYCI